MTEIATIDWFGRWGTSVFSELCYIFNYFFYLTFLFLLRAPEYDPLEGVLQDKKIDRALI